MKNIYRKNLCDNVILWINEAYACSIRKDQDYRIDKALSYLEVAYGLEIIYIDELYRLREYIYNATYFIHINSSKYFAGFCHDVKKVLLYGDEND